MLEKEVEQVLHLLTPENRLVLRGCLHTGLRISDVLQLRPQQLKPHFWVTEQKTGKRRQVVFPGREPGKHRCRQTVWKDVKRAARAMRLTQNVGPHSARKIYAVDLMKRYGDIDKVRRALNHDSETVTLIYAMADAQLQAKYGRRRPGKGRRRA